MRAVAGGRRRHCRGVVWDGSDVSFEFAAPAQVVDDPLLRAFALTNLVRSKDGEGMKWKIGIRQIRRNLGIIGGFDLGQGLQRPASDLDLKVPEIAQTIDSTQS